MIFWEKLCFDVFGPKGAQHFSGAKLFGKSLALRCLGLRGPKWAKNKVFQILGKKDTQNFADFLYKVKVAYLLKIDLIDFLLENLVLRF